MPISSAEGNRQDFVAILMHLNIPLFKKENGQSPDQKNNP
jgi:hypothetical protein